jgi:hypothetical protein
VTLTPGTTAPFESFTVPPTRELTDCEKDKQKVPINSVTKVASAALLAKTLPGDVEFFIVGSFEALGEQVLDRTDLFAGRCIQLRPGTAEGFLAESFWAKRA